MPDSVTLWTIAHQAPLAMGFSRREYWSGLPFPSPGDLPQTQVSHIVGRFFTIFATREVLISVHLTLPQLIAQDGIYHQC